MNAKQTSARAGFPWVSLNMAMSCDGKVATANRAVSSFGSPHDHQHLYELRSRADAVMCGATTVNDENADLGTGGSRYEARRIRNGLSRHNLRVVVSGSARLQPNSRIFSEEGGPIIVLVGSQASRERCEKLRTLGAHIHRSSSREIRLEKSIEWLFEKWNVRHLHCEGGSTLNDALFRADLIDEIHLTICPILMGGRQAPTVSDGQGISRLEDMRRFKFQRIRRVGNEHFCVLQRSGRGNIGKKNLKPEVPAMRPKPSGLSS